MLTHRAFPYVLAFAAAAVTVHAPKDAGASGPSATPTAAQIVARVVEADPWGLSGADVSARALVTEKSGKTRSLAFEAKSRRHAPPLGKSVISFSAPADVAGMKFLQIQNDSSDDERFLYTPELKRARRIAGSNRNESFMGTGFTYADLDGRDLRNSSSVLKGDETIGRFECFHLDVTPKGSDSVYSKIELWVRKDNFVPIKWLMFDKTSAPTKTLLAKEMRRVNGRWFITSSHMIDKGSGKDTDLVLDKIDRKDDMPNDTFSVRAIER